MSDVLFITIGTLIDGSGAPARRNVYLKTQNGTITAIDSLENLPSGIIALDDLTHCTVVPPLIDCSVSLCLSPSIDQSVRRTSRQGSTAKKAALLEQHVHYCHSHGVLGVADCDDTEGLVKLNQSTLSAENILEVQSAGKAIGSLDEYAAGNWHESDFLKIRYTKNIEDQYPSAQSMQYEDLYTILQHKGEKKAVVIANGEQQVGEAVAAGCEAIEQGYGMGEANLTLMAEKNVLWIPSILRAKNGLDSSGANGEIGCRFSTRYVAPGKAIPGAEAFWKKTFADQSLLLGLAKKLGVKTAIGSGAGNIGILHGESVVEEMKLFIKAGYSLEESIQCGSINGAVFFALKRLGSISVGQKATFLVTRGTAGQLPRKLGYLEDIYVNGRPSSAYRKNPVKAVQ
ncbi:amidohydrolase family protein [Desulfogranum marinum]|uniref:amidohydrolase family protein n=1 Tax=Desulfogranum marinum TaxID=453220 RepID=UPI0029C62277|nr:amidohydrolase family protein [Desulfogranum marinum]